MADDWRVTVAFIDAIDAHAAVQALREHHADGSRRRRGDGVAVSVDGPHLFLYAATEDVARAAERVVREVLAQYQLVTAGSGSTAGIQTNRTGKTRRSGCLAVKRSGRQSVSA